MDFSIDSSDRRILDAVPLVGEAVEGLLSAAVSCEDPPGHCKRSCVCFVRGRLHDDFLLLLELAFIFVNERLVQ